MQIEIFIVKACKQPPKKDLKLSTLKFHKCKNILLKGSCKLQKYTYEFRVKKKPQIKNFQLTNCKLQKIYNP